jgi:hypothetical protein
VDGAMESRNFIKLEITIAALLLVVLVLSFVVKEYKADKSH